MSVSSIPANPTPQFLPLGREDMDETHRQFVDLWSRAVNASKDDFATVLAELLRHTESHFENENALMAASSFPATQEHQAEHQRVLGELARFLQRADTGNQALARAWLTEQVPDWFDNHLRTMDSALAAHLALN